MAKCEVCGNEYDKAFELIAAGRGTHLTALSARFRRLRRFVNIASAE